jgi:cell division protein FtsB
MGIVRRILLVVAAIALAGVAAAMVMDPHGYRLYRQLGRDVRRVESENAVLASRIDLLQKKVEALREGPKALERAAHENGYVHSDEILFELK